MRLEQHLSNSTDKYTVKAKDWILKTVFEVSNSEGDAMKIERYIKKQKSQNLILLLCDSKFFIPARTGRDLSLLLCAEFFIANGHIETCPALAGSKTKVNHTASVGFLFYLTYYNNFQSSKPPTHIFLSKGKIGSLAQQVSTISKHRLIGFRASE